MLNGYEYRGFFEKQYIDFCTDHGFHSWSVFRMGQAVLRFHFR